MGVAQQACEIVDQPARRHRLGQILSRNTGGRKRGPEQEHPQKTQYRSHHAFRLELHFRSLFRSLLRFEIVQRSKTEHAGEQIAREHFDIGIERLGSLVILAALDGNPVFGSLQLRLQIAEVLTGLQIGIAFRMAIRRLSAEESSP